MQLLLRTLIAWLAGLSSLLIFGTLGTLGVLIDESGDFSFHCARLWSKVILIAAGIKVRVIGLEHLRSDRPQVIVSNHQGNFDIWLLMAYLPVQFRWVSKKEVFRIPLVGGTMRGARHISIQRGSPRQALLKLIREARQRIKQGKSILIFPEGTRSSNGKVGNFKRGAFFLATKTNVPIVPLTINGSFQIQPRGTILVHPQRVTIIINPPIVVSKLSPQEKQELPQQIENLMRKQVNAGKSL